MSNSFFERANPPPRRKTCIACTKAKRRCDHGHPACLRCSRRNIDCVYPSQSASRSKTLAAQRPRKNTETPLPEDGPVVPAETPTATTDETEEWVCADAALVPWSQDPDPLPLEMEDMDEIALNMDFDNLINPDAFFGGALSVPATLTPRADHMLVSSQCPLPENSSEDVIASRVQYALDVMKGAPSSMVLENQTPWCHPYLYRAHMPRDMQDAQACCALYIAKNPHNSSIVLRTIQARAHELLASPLPKGRTEILARIHAIILYQIIRLFDGDITTRASAQQTLSAFEPAVLALLPFVKWNRTQPETGPAEEQQPCPTKDFWQEWIFQESARRTIFFVSFFLVLYQTLVGQLIAGGCRERYIFCQSWTMSAHLWNSQNVVDFAIAWREKRHFTANKHCFTDVLREAAADDVDVFARMFMVGALGIDETRLWFYNKGGSL
ncbi:uncharacterized protein CTRU02_202863 [Colletotrichum truncatum]|uniref:Uncharacterized protein n=1 Tax=Colletotrichum truncatum TaxID=5467 RepID=A0ACC3ZLJ5_COLTU|nr:uncharacterized protein CTRU02_12957 [Colletotrichum truncatum]KAF6783941.1 hypothetical protein CTRU02_12957 [Colletotrichum truncatum]